MGTILAEKNGIKYLMYVPNYDKKLLQNISDKGYDAVYYGHKLQMQLDFIAVDFIAVDFI